MATTANLVRIVKFSAETGYTDKAVRRKIEDGVWVEGVHYVRAPDGALLMDMDAYHAWARGEKPDGKKSD